MPPKKKKRKPRSRARGTAATPAAATAEQTPASQEKRRERLEARREAKAKALAARRKQQQRARIVRIVVTIASVAVIVWFLFLRNSIPDAIAGHEIEHFDTFASESRAGTLHTGAAITYASEPPVSGDHRPIAAECGVYSEQIPNENMVHTLEHGAVGVLYQPTAEPDEIKQIEEIVKSYESHTFSAPYPNLEDPYTVVAWAHLMRLDSYDEPAIKEFIDFFREGADSPEDQDCDLNVDSSFGTPPTPSPTGSATPAPTKTPEKKAPDKRSGDGKKKKKKD